MTIAHQFKAIYLGDVDKSQYIDRYEGIQDTENAASLTGTTFGSASAPLSSQFYTVTTHDRDGDGALNGENWSGYYERFTTDRPVPVTGTARTDSDFWFDGVTQYHATITYADGSSANGVLSVMQDDLGRTFVVPSLIDSRNDVIEAGQIQSIKLGRVAEYDWDNNHLQTDRPDWQGVPCFADGTRILTEKGHRPIEKLAVGDMVQTVDHGMQAVRWHGVRRLDAVDLAANPNLRPIRIRRGALGDRLPKRDLLVSPQHRMLVRSGVAQTLFGVDEVLVAAKHLLALDGVEVADDVTEVGYHHILFDRHEVVFAEGAASESLYTGEQALKMVGPAARAEIFALFPELQGGTELAVGARVFLSGRQGRELVERHRGHALQ